MKTRIISACMMLPLLALVYLGGYWLMGACVIVSAIAVREFYRGYEAVGTKPAYGPAYGGLFLLYLFEICLPGDTRLMLFWAVLMVMASMIYGFKVNERKLEDMSATLLGIFYCVLFPFHITLIDRSEYSILIWLVFLAAFGTDIMAYFVGMAIGKHKLCPNLSPKKSKEGAVGGVLGSIIFCGIFTYFVIPDMMAESMFIAIAGSIVAQLGDLSASAFKRQMGIKDYGNLIPGHGGILDRFDSVFFTAPMVYYCILFVNEAQEAMPAMAIFWN